jgi:pimeloyl-ACP methyl ester carboxylesterase
MKITTITTGRKFRALAAAAALISATFIAIPSIASAAPQCDGKFPVQTCGGATSDGAPYGIKVPANFNGTVYLWSHGYRYNVDIPAAIPLIGGYKITNTPEPGPIIGSDTSVISYLLSKGFAVMGSGFARQGWNADSGVATDVELINTFKTQFPTTSHVIAWGNSLGGFITQTLAEKNPSLISAAAPLCVATPTVEAELQMAGDFLWGLKTYFDPTIKGGNYSAGAAGYGEAMADLGKVFTIMGKLQAAMASGAWPDTAPAAIHASGLDAVPSRSALLLVGLMAGVPTQSAHFDGTTGPGSANSSAYTSFAAAASPALAILENGTTAAALAVLATYDVEQQAGGTVFDNTKTDYAARVATETTVFNAALSGAAATQGLLAYLARAPRATASESSLAKMRSLAQWTGKINMPTIAMTGVADPVTPAGDLTYLAQQYLKQWQAGHSTTTRTGPNLITILGQTPVHYTTFDASGSPITSTPAANGTNHCNFTAKQYIAVANMLAYASKNGTNLSGGPLLTAVRKMGGSTSDKKSLPTLPKFYVTD